MTPPMKWHGVASDELAVLPASEYERLVAECEAVAPVEASASHRAPPREAVAGHGRSTSRLPRELAEGSGR